MKIVIVDNNFAVRHLLAIYLRSLFFYLGEKVEIYVAPNGIEGIGYIYVVKPDIILVDSELEKYSGKDIHDFLANNSQINPARINFLVKNGRDINEKSKKKYYQCFDKFKFDFLKKVGIYIFLLSGRDAKAFGKETNGVGFWLFNRLSRPIIRISELSAKLHPKTEKHVHSLTLLKGIGWFVLQILESVLLSLVFLFWGRGKFESIKLEKSDVTKLRIKYYPSLVGGFATLLFVFSQILFFAAGGAVFFNIRIKGNSTTFANNFVSFELADYSYNKEQLTPDENFIELKNLSDNAASDSGTVLEPSYSTSKPSLSTRSPVVYSQLEQILLGSNFEASELSVQNPTWGYTLGSYPENAISMQLSPNNKDWYFYNGVEWAVTEAGWLNSNSVQEVNSYLSSLNFENKELYIRLFFLSDGNTQVELQELRVNRTNDLVTVVEQEPEAPPAPAVASASVDILFGALEPKILNAAWVDGQKIIAGKLVIPDNVKFEPGRENNLKVGIYFANSQYQNEIPDAKGELLGFTDVEFVPETGEYIFELNTPGEDGGFLTAELLMVDADVQTISLDANIPSSAPVSGPVNRNNALRFSQQDILNASKLATVVENSTFTVTETTDLSDMVPGDGSCDNSAVAGIQCSLRAAIEEANALAGSDDILFAIGAGTVQTITPASSLPTITSVIDIQGDTETGATCNPLNPLIELDGSTAGGVGLTLGAGSDGSTISGIILNGHWGDKIVVDGANNTTIECNFIGTANDGITEQFLGGGGRGVVIQNGSDGTTIGGTSTANRNIIGDNDGMAIYNSDSPNTTIQANFIGVDVTGVGNYENEDGGIYVVGSSAINNSDGMIIGGNTGTTPGGSCTGACNVINSADSEEGIYIDLFSDNITIFGNYIGMGSDGETETQGAGVNQSDGIYIVDGDDITIGDGTANGRNVIGGNTLREIYVDTNILGGGRGLTNLTIDGNYIGIHADEAGIFTQGAEGIRINTAATDDTSNLLIQNNVVGGTSNLAIEVGTGDYPNNVIRANTLGTDATTQTQNFGFSGYGIRVSDADAVIGGTNPADGNYVSNAQDDISIQASTADDATIQNNTITNHAADAIQVFSSDSVSVQDNTIHDGTDGISIFQFATNTTVERNTIYNITPDGPALYIGNFSTNSTIAHNIIYNITAPSYGAVYIHNDGSTGNTIANNYINNATVGVYVREDDNYIYNNNITGSTNQGILLLNNAQEVPIVGNTIASSGGIGIDLNNDGVTLNDVNDSDGGENRSQNFAEPTSVNYTGTGGTLSVFGSLNTRSNRDYLVQAFSSTTADGTGYGEGEFLIGNATVATTGNDFDFSVTPITIATTSYPENHTVLTLTTTECSDATCTTLLDSSEFSATATINPFFELDAATANDAENVGGNIPNIIVTGVVQTPATVDVNITGGTATGGGTDYTLASTTVNIPAATYNSSTFAIPLSIDDDALNEGNETIDFNISTADANLFLADVDGDATTQSTHTYTINDDDTGANVDVDFNSATFSAAEDSTTVNLVLDVSGDDITAVGAQSIDVDITGGTATGGGTDYTFTDPTTVTIPAADYTTPTTINVPVTLTTDSVIENDETVTFDLINPSANVTVDTQNTTTLTITNDDALTAQFSSATYTAFETGGTMNFVVSVSGADSSSSGVETVDIDITGGTATAGGTDYTFTDPTTVSIPAADYTGGVNINSSVTITDDNLVEANETITADLINPAANTNIGATSSTTATIVSDDVLTAQFTSATYSVAENGGSVDFVINVTGADSSSSGAESIDIDITGGTATGSGTDYTFTDPTTVNIPAADYTGGVTFNSSVSITNDSLIEADETITAGLINPSANAVVGATSSTTTTITNDDALSTEFSSATYTVTENGTTVNLVLQVSGADSSGSGAESIDVDITGGTASGGGTDYTYTDPTTVTIPAADYTGTSTVNTAVNIVDDLMVETDETVIFGLISPSANNAVGAQNSSTLTITDQDILTVEFSAASYSAAENSGSTNLVVEVSGADTTSSGAETLDITITGGTATGGGDDYTFTSPTTITIPAADYTTLTTFTTPVSLVDESTVESDETVTFGITLTSAGTVLGTNSATTLTITNDDSSGGGSQGGGSGSSPTPTPTEESTPEPTPEDDDGGQSPTPTPTEESEPQSTPTPQLTPVTDGGDSDDESTGGSSQSSNSCSEEFTVDQTILEIDETVSEGRLCLEGNYQMDVFVSYTNNKNHDGIAYSSSSNQFTHCLDLVGLAAGESYEYEINASSEACGTYTETLGFNVPELLVVEEEIKETTTVLGNTIYSIEQEEGQPDDVLEINDTIIENIKVVTDSVGLKDDFGFEPEPVLLLPFVPLLVVNVASNPAVLINSVPWLMVIRRRRWGKVYDSITGKPVPFADIELRPKDKKELDKPKTLSSADGGYAFKDILPGTYQVVVKHPQYFPREMFIDISDENEIEEKNIALAERNVHSGTPLKLRIRAFMHRVLKPLNNILFGFGCVFAFAVFMVYPTWFNLLILSVYVAQILVQLYFRFRTTRFVFR